MNKLLIIPILFLSIASAPVMSAETKGYFGGAVGQGEIDVGDGADRIDDEDTIFKIFGGINVSPRFSAEFGFIDFGEYSAHFPFLDETDEFDGTALFASAIGKIKLSDRVKVIIKGGMAFWDVDASARATVLGIPISGSGDETGFDPFFGIGAEFQTSDRTVIRIEFEEYQDVADGLEVTVPGLGSVEIEGEDVEVFNLAIIVLFGPGS